MKTDITQKMLHDALTYDASTGDFFWKIKPNRKILIGSKAGCVRSDNGYVLIGFSGTYVLAHRLAWLYVYGVMPEQIDHINHNRADNRITNLRACSVVENRRNSLRPSNNTSGLKGVSFCARESRWRSYIKVNRRMISLGYFDTKELAHAAYCKKAAELFGEYACNG